VRIIFSPIYPSFSLPSPPPLYRYRGGRGERNDNVLPLRGMKKGMRGKRHYSVLFICKSSKKIYIIANKRKK
jgi:hypothetical protein